jgi:hypothetical protein
MIFIHYKIYDQKFRFAQILPPICSNLIEITYTFQVKSKPIDSSRIAL